MLDVSRGLIHEWEAGCMEEEGCCRCRCRCRCGGEARSHREDALVQLLRQREMRQTRVIPFLAVVLLLLVSGTLALLVSVVLGERGHRSPDSQLMVQPDSHSSGVRFERQQQKDLKRPSAMLTAPRVTNINGEYLEWESAIGNAFCQGGFNYSSASLVVPRTGIYRVFLQITYESKENLKCDPGEDEHRLSIGVFSIQDSYKNDVQLLSSVDSVNCSLKWWSKSLYTAGLFLLEANCRLHVTSSKRELIVKTEYQVFFGAELLP